MSYTRRGSGVQINRWHGIAEICPRCRDIMDARARRQAERPLMTDTHMLDVQTDSVPAEVRIRNAEAAIAKYGDPARALGMIGVTGTNGKTTTVNILRSLLHRPEAPAASIGTLGVLVGDGDLLPGGLGLTTPGPDELQRVLRALADRRIATVIMEVSSHALDQRRIHGIAFDAALFTNLTRDHLVYHKTMQSYFCQQSEIGRLV